MSGDHKTRSRSLSPGSGNCRRRYDWNTVHFYPDIHQPTEQDSRPLSSSSVGDRDATTDETVTSHDDDDCQDDDSYDDDESSDDDADEWCYSPSDDDDECGGKSARHDDDVRENVGKEKKTTSSSDVTRKRVKWLDQQKKDSSEEENPAAERVTSSLSSISSRWSHGKEAKNSCSITRRHPPVKYETNVDSESSPEDDDDDDGHLLLLPGENSTNSISSLRGSNGFGGAHLLFIDESDDDDDEDAKQQQQPTSSSAAAEEEDEEEEMTRPTENERREEKKVEGGGPRYLETHLDDDSWPQVDAVPAPRAIEEQTMVLKSILRAKQRRRPQQQVVVCDASRDRSRVKAAAGNLETLENAESGLVVEKNERLVDWSPAERLPRPLDFFVSTAAAEGDQTKGSKGQKPLHQASISPSASAAVAAGDGDADDDAMSRIREQQKNRRRFVFDYRLNLIDRKMAADDSSEEPSSDALTLEEFELCLDVHKDEENLPQEEEEEEKQQQQQPEVGSYIPLELTSVPISKPEAIISNFNNKRTDDIRIATSVQEDPEMLWLFDSVQRSRIQGTGGYPSSSIGDNRRPKSADSAGTQYPRRILENSLFEGEDGRRNACDRVPVLSPGYLQLPSTVTTTTSRRQQYRWSTCIKEPEARILIDGDDFQPNDVTSLRRRDLPMTSRYPAMYKMKKFPTYRESPEDESTTTEKKGTAAAAAAAERGFTVVGQPRSRKPLQLGGDVDPSAPAGYALAAHRALGTIHEGGSYYGSGRRHPPQPPFTQQQQMHPPSPEDCSPQNNRKFKYLRERVLAAVAPEPAADSLPPLSRRTVVGYESLQNLEDMLAGRELLDHRQQSPCYQMMMMTSSAHSLPHNLLLFHPSDQSPAYRRRRFLMDSDQLMTSGAAHWSSQPIEEDAQRKQQQNMKQMRAEHLLLPPPLVGGGGFFYGGGGVGLPLDTVSLCSDSGINRGAHQPNRLRPNTQQTKTPRIVKARNQMKALHKGGGGGGGGNVSDHQQLMVRSSEV